MDLKCTVHAKVRVPCGLCGEEADQRHTYLLPNARLNPASSAYRGDDIRFCSDHELFTCSDCRSEFGGRAPNVDGYEWCATVNAASKTWEAMFWTWQERKDLDLLDFARKALTLTQTYLPPDSGITQGQAFNDLLALIDTHPALLFIAKATQS